MNVRYWRSFEDLERFASNQDDPHLAAWGSANADCDSITVAVSTGTTQEDA